MSFAPSEIDQSSLRPWLGLSLPSSLPQTDVCPVCQQRRLITYQDTKEFLEWHYCFSCCFTGDSVALVSQTKGWSREQTLDFLAEQDWLLSATALRANRMRRRRKQVTVAQQLLVNWRQLQQQALLDAHGMFSRLCQPLGIRPLVCSPERAASLCPPFGLIFQEQLPWLHRPAVGYPGKPLSLPSLTAAIVLPFFVAPGRIAGMLLISPEDLDRPYYFSHRNLVGLSKVPSRVRIGTNHDYASGLAGLETVLREPPEATQEIVAISDEQLFLYQHVRQFQTRDQGLPLVLVRKNSEDGPPQASLRFLKNRTISVWSKQPEPDCLAVAMQVQGQYLTGDYPQGTSTKRYPAETVPNVQLRQIQKRASSWQKWLRDTYGADERGKNQLLRQTAARCPAVAPLVLTIEQPETADRCNLVVSNNQLYSPAGSLIMNAYPAVRQIIHYPNKQVEYRGIVRHRLFPETVNFVCRCSGSPSRSNQELCRAVERVVSKKGQSLYLGPNSLQIWRDIFGVADAKVSEGHLSLGWDGQQLVLCNCVLRDGEFIEPHAALYHNKIIGGPRLRPQARERVYRTDTDTQKNREIWQLAFHLAAMICQPIGNWSTRPTLFLNRSSTFQRTLQNLGVCLQFPAHPRDLRRPWAHNWPVVRWEQHERPWEAKNVQSVLQNSSCFTGFQLGNRFAKVSLDTHDVDVLWFPTLENTVCPVYDHRLLRVLKLCSQQLFQFTPRANEHPSRTVQRLVLQVLDLPAIRNSRPPRLKSLGTSLSSSD